VATRRAKRARRRAAVCDDAAAPPSEEFVLVIAGDSVFCRLPSWPKGAVAARGGHLA
jgi:hypothetical protein